METLNEELMKCRFCSEVSKQNGEDTNGTLYPFDSWLMFEIKQPWNVNMLAEPQPIPQTAIDLIQEIHQQRKIKFWQLAIAPDREYSTSDRIRIFHYSRPAQLFAKYDKREYLLPWELIGELIFALCKKPQLLTNFDKYLQDTSHIREIMVCTHGNVDVACARFGYPIYQELRQNYACSHLRIWRCSHFGGHQFAPTLIDMPYGRSWGHLTSEILPNIIYQKGDINQLRLFYRGFFGLPSFAQILEGEIWLQEGWNWYEYLKFGQVLELTEDKTKAVVEVNFASPNQEVKGKYQGIIKQTHQVITQHQSKDKNLLSIPQYQVFNLKCLPLKDKQFSSI